VLGTLFKKGSQPGIFAIGVDTEGIAVVRVLTKPGQRPLVLAGLFFPYDDKVTNDELMEAIAQKYHLHEGVCSLVLENGDYRLLLTESPDVPIEERSAALRWRIKDLIDTPVNDVTLDVFDVPRTATAQESSVYVVAARNEVIWQHVNLLKAAKVNLRIIDIAEMAQRNIARLLPEDASGVATLSLRRHYSLITLSKAGELYFSRTLNVGLDNIREKQQHESSFSQIANELQRSLDYYESHFRQEPIHHVALMPLPSDLTDLLEYLRQNLSVEIKVVDLNELVDHAIDMSQEVQAKIFLPFGAALREQAA
jgi:MSHA biogenesis protein MshI